MKTILRRTLFGFVLGMAAGMGGTALYDAMERWPLLVTDAVHFALVMAVFVPVALFLGWTDTPGGLLAISGVMLAAHLAIFLVMCAYYRTEVKLLNKLQKQRFDREGKMGGGAV